MSAVRRFCSAVSETSDAELMRRVQDDDAEAFGQLYDRHVARARRVAGAICHRSGGAEEAVQEGFIAIWKSRKSYQPSRGDVGAWLTAIVRNRAIDVTRSLSRHERGRGDAEPPDLEALVDIDADAIAGEDAQRLRALLAGLPDKQREVITLAFYGELSHTEIASYLGLPTGTVKGRMRLGLRQLRDLQ